MGQDAIVCDKVAVIGLGSWGTAASGLVARHAGQVMGWVFEREVAEGINAEHRNPLYLTGYTLPENVRATNDLAEAVTGADAIVVVVPSAFLRATMRQMAPSVSDDTPVLVLTKGIEPGTGLLMTDIVAEELGKPARVACLSGPNHAEEICQGKPAAAVIASQDQAVAETFRALFIDQSFRAYVSSDVTGVEVCAAVKNVIAIACGIARGLELGDNALSVLMTRGLAEVARIACAMGGDPITCMGLAGMGDLVTTCMSPHSRNGSFGAALVAGETLEEYQARTHMVVEGAVAALSAHQICERLGVEAPVVDAVWSVLYNGSSVREEMRRMLDRLPYEEFYGFEEAFRGEGA